MGVTTVFVKKSVWGAALMALGVAIAGCADMAPVQTPPSDQTVYLRRHSVDDAGTAIVEHAECRSGAAVQACVEQHQAAGYVAAEAPLASQASHADEDLTRWMKNFRRRD